MLWVCHSEPFAFACTVVAEGHLPLPYHSRMSISPCASLDNHQAGQAPGVRQSSLIRASQMLPMLPSHKLFTLPPKYVLPSLSARMTRLELPSTNTLRRSSRY